jgi:hypothetical protein
MRAIAQVSKPDLLETMNALIVPGLFSGLDTTAPAGLVPASFARTLFRFANFAFIYFKKPGWALPVKSAGTYLLWPSPF